MPDLVKWARQKSNGGLVPISPPPGPFDKFADDQHVALCLVPRGGSEYDVYAVVDGSTDGPIVVWTQNVADRFMFPA